MKTSKLLLQRAKENHQSEDWNRLVSIYAPLIRRWLTRCGVHENDTLDLAQEVLCTLVTDLPRFEHNGRTGAFRNWLRTITVNRCRRLWEQKKRHVPLAGSMDGQVLLQQLADPKSETSKRWDQEHDQFVLSRVLQLLTQEFDETTMEAFRRSAIEGQTAKHIAEQLEVSVGQVYKYKFRVMQRLSAEVRSILNLAQTSVPSPSLSSSGSALMAS